MKTVMRSKFAVFAVALLLAAGAWTASDAQSAAGNLGKYLGVDHSQLALAFPTGQASKITEEVTARRAPVAKVSLAALQTAALATGMSLPTAPGGSRTDAQQNATVAGTIDKNIFERLAQEGVAPAPPTNDYEFVRRVTLDLTGAIPNADEVIAFVTDARPDKRARLIDQLLASPEWVDKWTIWFGDHYENNSNNVLNARRYVPGVLSFNDFIRTSLLTSKPYDQMARELIAAEGTNSYDQGELNFLVAGVMGGGPVQDIFDKEIAVTAEKFLGISHLDCLLCHDGRGHLDSLSLWGYVSSRQQAWSMASFMSHTATVRVPVNPGVQNPYYWALRDDVVLGGRRGQDFTVDYKLNTQTGNRPARGAVDSTQTIAPAYIFDGEGPAPGERYREALARKITGDFQFARATVNFMWENFFGIGIVTPSNQFDPLRLDPDNPPVNCPIPANPCELQPSHPRLLNELAQDFIDSGYDLRALMRQIANSRAYQLSSRYEGEWDSANERLFARKLVRRLWAEEIHDAVVKSSGVPASYTSRNWGTVTRAMQLPEPLNTPNFAVSGFLDAFLRGNRDDETRRGDTSITLSLAMMNDAFVIQRVFLNRQGSLISNVLPLPDDQAIYGIYLTALSRFPTPEEYAAVQQNIQQGNREAELRILLWALYNKVDFLFNY